MLKEVPSSQQSRRPDVCTSGGRGGVGGGAKLNSVSPLLRFSVEVHLLLSWVERGCDHQVEQLPPPVGMEVAFSVLIAGLLIKLFRGFTGKTVIFV